MFVEHQKIVDELKSNAYSFIPSSHIKININEIDEFLKLKRSWDFLSKDPYMKPEDNYRRRGFCKFRLNLQKEELNFVDDNLFIQEEKINAYAGGVKRYLPKMNDSLTRNIVLKKIILNTLNTFLMYKDKANKDWDVFVHQFRIEAREDKIGNPTPEGIHKDGHTFISMHLINRKNIYGGESCIYDKDKIKTKEIMLKYIRQLTHR